MLNELAHACLVDWPILIHSEAVGYEYRKPLARLEMHRYI